MTTTSFIKDVAKVSGQTIKSVKEISDAFETVIREKIKSGESFKLFDVNYSVKDVPERSGFNPLTKEHTTFPPTKKVSVKASSTLKNYLKEDDSE